MKNCTAFLLTFFASLLYLASNAAELSSNKKNLVEVPGADGKTVELSMLRTVQKYKIIETVIAGDCTFVTKVEEQTYVTSTQTNESDLLSPSIDKFNNGEL